MLMSLDLPTLLTGHYQRVEMGLVHLVMIRRIKQLVLWVKANRLRVP